MEDETVKQEDRTDDGSEGIAQQRPPTKSKSRSKNTDGAQGSKRRCVSSACIACRKRKSKCDGNLPSCAACSSVYHTPCIYDPNSDHRRKGVYKQDIANLKNRNTTLQTLVQAILNYDEDDVPELVRQIRSGEDLGDVAESIVSQQRNRLPGIQEGTDAVSDDGHGSDAPQFESELTGKVSEMRLEGALKYVGGTSNLIFLPSSGSEDNDELDSHDEDDEDDNEKEASPEPIARWTEVTNDTNLIRHILTMYFTWHYSYFTTLSKELFYHDFMLGQPSQYCSSLLVNAMLALGSHFTDFPAAREIPSDPSTAGDHFFKEAKRLILDNDEHERAKLCTVQALALMSVREAGCCREGSGWVYSGMSFRMAYDLGLNMDVTTSGSKKLDDKQIDARRITFWGCFLFDKCWSNYLGRQPQLSGSHLTVPKFEIFAEEDAETWAPYTDSGALSMHSQASRTRAVGLQISRLCEISSDLLATFYHPASSEKPMGKQEELRRLSQLHNRLETWRKELPGEFEPKDGQLPPVLVMHMFFQLLFIHLYRPFLKYTKTTSPIPAQTSPRKQCTQAASIISKLLRMYQRSYGLRQICNVAVYIVHSACTIHLLNLPDKGAQRDISYGLKNLEEIAEGWLCARRTIHILEVLANKWNVLIPSEAAAVFERSRAKYGSWKTTPQTHSDPSSRDSPGDDRAGGSISIPHSNSPAPPPYRVGSRPQTQPASLGTMIAQHAESSPSSSGTPYPQAPYLQPSTPEQQMGPQTHHQSVPHNTGMGPGDPQHYNAPGVDIGIPSDNNANPQISALSGVENLLLGSQNWWYRDQSSLALGLGNWDAEIWESPSREAGNPAMGMNPDERPMTSHTAGSFGSYGHMPPMISPTHNLYDASQMNMDFDVSVTHTGYGDGYMVTPSQSQSTSQPQQPLGQGQGNEY